MFQRILVPLDGSHLAENVLPHVIAVSSISSAKLYLQRVLEAPGSGVRPVSVDPVDWQIRKTESEAYLHKIASNMQKLGIPVEVSLQEGKPAENIIDYAHELNADLIALSSHGSSGLSGWNVSSVVQKIILRARTSILLSRAYQPAPGEPGTLHYKRILLPLDGSPRAECVLPAAVALANAHGAELLLAHVVRQPELPRRTPPSHEDLELSQQFVDRNRVEAEQYLSDVSSHIDTKTQTRLLVSNSVADSLHDLVTQSESDLVILSAHGYTGGTKWPYGSVVVSFIAYGITPLLIIQDLPRDRLELTQAEMIAQKAGGR